VNMIMNFIEVTTKYIQELPEIHNHYFEDINKTLTRVTVLTRIKRDY